MFDHPTILDCGFGACCDGLCTDNGVEQRLSAAIWKYFVDLPKHSSRFQHGNLLFVQITSGGKVQSDPKTYRKGRDPSIQDYPIKRMVIDERGINGGIRGSKANAFHAAPRHGEVDDCGPECQEQQEHTEFDRS